MMQSQQDRHTGGVRIVSGSRGPTPLTPNSSSTPSPSSSKRRVVGEPRAVGVGVNVTSKSTQQNGGSRSQQSSSSEGGGVVNHGRQIQGGNVVGQMSYSKVAKVGALKANGVHHLKQSGQWQQQQQQQQQSMNERLLHASVCSVGCKAKVQVNSGCLFEGVLSTLVSTPEEEGLSLKVCTKTRQGLKAEMVGTVEKEQVFDGKDMVMVEVFDVDMDGLVSDSGQLATDQAISGNTSKGGSHRVLQPWVDTSVSAPNTMMSLDENGYKPGMFDQFSVNKTRFGIEATFNEEEYTTKLNKSKCAISEEKAQSIADSIMKSNMANGVSRNYHLAEERGEDLDDLGMDEEEKYSSVIRQEEKDRTKQPQQVQQQRSNKLCKNDVKQQEISQQDTVSESVSENHKSKAEEVQQLKRSSPSQTIPIPRKSEDIVEIKQSQKGSNSSNQSGRAGLKSIISPMATPGQMSPLQESPMMKKYNLDVAQVDPKVQKEFQQWKMKKEPENLKKQLNKLKEFGKQSLKIPHDDEREKSGLTDALNKEKDIAPTHDSNSDYNDKSNVMTYDMQKQIEQQTTSNLHINSSQPPQEPTGVSRKGQESQQYKEKGYEEQQNEVRTSMTPKLGAQNNEDQSGQLGFALNPDAKEFTLNPTAREFVPFIPNAPTPHLMQYPPPRSESSPGSQTPNSVERPDNYPGYNPVSQKQYPVFPPHPQYPNAPYHQPQLMAPYPPPYSYVPIPTQGPHMPPPQSFVGGRPPQMAAYHPQSHYPAYPMHPQQIPQGQFQGQMIIPMMTPQGPHYPPPPMMGGPVPMGMPPPGYIHPVPIANGSQGVPPPIRGQQQPHIPPHAHHPHYASNSPRPSGGTNAAGGVEMLQTAPPPPPMQQMRQIQQPSPQQQQQLESIPLAQQYYTQAPVQ